LAARNLHSLSGCRQKKPQTIVGGAPVTQEFADEIGADAYGKDAVSGAEKAKELLGLT